MLTSARSLAGRMSPSRATQDPDRYASDRSTGTGVRGRRVIPISCGSGQISPDGDTGGVPGASSGTIPAGIRPEVRSGLQWPQHQANAPLEASTVAINAFE